MALNAFPSFPRPALVKCVSDRWEIDSTVELAIYLADIEIPQVERGFRYRAFPKT